MFHDVEQRSHATMSSALQTRGIEPTITGGHIRCDSRQHSYGTIDASRPVALGVTSIHHLIVIEAGGDAEFRYKFGNGCTLNDALAAPTCLDKAICCPVATIFAGRYSVAVQFMVRILVYII